MGKDVRGIERRNCACGECKDFMRSDGANCGCLQTCHSKKDARYSSDSVDGTSAAGTGESTSPDKWKDEDLGWFPNPRGEYSDVVDRVVCSSSSSLSDKSSQETGFIPEPREHQNMGESRHGSRETIRLILTGSFACIYKIEATWSNFFLAKKNYCPPQVENKTGLTLPNL